MRGDGAPQIQAGIKGRLTHLEVLSGTTPAELEQAFEDWRQLAEEKRIHPESISFTDDGTNLRMYFLYATE